MPNDLFNDAMLDNLIRRVRLNFDAGVSEVDIIQALRSEYCITDIFLAIQFVRVIDNHG